jgi:hypothetical protein
MKKCRILGYKNPVHTSQETHYFSATEPRRLMLSKFEVFHGGDYEECRLLGYKNPVRTSQETRLTLWKFWDFHSGDYEGHRLLGLRRVALVATDDSGQRIASIIRVTRMGDLGTTLIRVVSCNRSTLQRVHGSPILVTLLMEGICSPESPVLTRATGR